jgi:hypothetical protein
MVYIFVNCVTMVLFEGDLVRAGMARREIEDSPPHSHAETRVAVRTVFLLGVEDGMMDVRLGWEGKWSIAGRYVEGRKQGGLERQEENVSPDWVMGLCRLGRKSTNEIDH